MSGLQHEELFQRLFLNTRSNYGRQSFLELPGGIAGAGSSMERMAVMLVWLASL